MMRDLSRRDFLVAVAAAASTAGVRAQTVPLRQEASAGQAVPSLKDACRGVFLIGTAFDFRTPTEFTPAEINFIKAQFNAITPENSMKPGPVHPQEAVVELDAAGHAGAVRRRRTRSGRSATPSCGTRRRIRGFLRMRPAMCCWRG